MHILVLGATSQIGSALEQEFSAGNSLLLVGRNGSRLQAVGRLCEEAGAAQVRLVELDLSLGVEPLLQAGQGISIGLLIDAASASSAKRDAEIEPTEIGGLVAADFVSRTEIFGQLLSQQAAPPAVIYISTVLTLVKSPGRVVYASLKSLYETYLQKLKARRPDFRLLVVYVGTVVDPKNVSEKPRRLAAAVAKAFAAKKETMFYGLSGRVFIGLFYFQPLVFSLVALMQRKVRAWLARRP